MSHFVLVDCNNFYASCERLFQPKLENSPVIVLSNNDGCVVARSQEAKQLGIKMGEPFFQIKNLCKQNKVVVCSSNYQLYGDLSHRVMQILSDMAPDIQIYSIDEAFLTYPNSLSHKIIWDQSVDIRKKIKKWVGIPTSIGIAPTKTLAKIANDLAKKDRKVGVFDLTSAEVQQRILDDYPVEDIWGVGKSTAAKLHTLGIYTALELRDAEPTLIRKKMGVVGERMVWELRGVSCLPLEEAKQKQSISCSRSFGIVVTEMSDLAEALATFINTASLKLRKQKSCAAAMCIYLEAALNVQTGTRQQFSTLIPFPIPTNDTPQMISAAKRKLPQLFCENQRYKKCGVILLDLVPENEVMPDFFLGSINPKRHHLMQTVDSLNQRFGKNKLFFGAMGINPQWKKRSNSLSAQFTTNWDTLALVRA